MTFKQSLYTRLSTLSREREAGGMIKSRIKTETDILTVQSVDDDRNLPSSDNDIPPPAYDDESPDSHLLAALKETAKK